jgi:hypothetical protein
MLCPPLKVKGNAGPLTENPVPVVCQAESFTFQERVLVRTTGSVELDPTDTWPNETLAGLAVKLSLVVPVPRMFNRSAGFEAVLVNVPTPGTHPATVGEKITLSETLCPAARFKGKLKLERLNSVPLRLNADTVTLVCPPFVKTTTWVSVCPSGTAPKRNRDGVQVNCWVAALAHKFNIVTNIVIVMRKKTRVEKGWGRDWGSLMSPV